MILSTILLSALAVGFLGSFHCVGMCGPIALSLPVQHLIGFKKLLGILLYNIGRALTYASIGLILGWIGSRFSLAGWQQLLSISLGILLIISFFDAIFHKRLFQVKWIQNYWNKHVINLLARLMQQRSVTVLLGIGLLNGLLPCGMVYMAAAMATSTGDTLTGALFMAAFGLGTMPVMIAMNYAGNFISTAMRQKIRKATPYIVGIMGLLLVIRGLNLGIPFISPEINTTEQVTSCH